MDKAILLHAHDCVDVTVKSQVVNLMLPMQQIGWKTDNCTEPCVHPDDEIYCHSDSSGLSYDCSWQEVRIA